MKRINVGKVLVGLDGKPIQQDDKELTLRDLITMSITQVVGVSMEAAPILWKKVGLALVGSDDEYLELEDAVFAKLKAAYWHPQALPAHLLWAKAYIAMGLTEAEGTKE